MSALARQIATDRNRPLNVRLAALYKLFAAEQITVTAQDACKGGYRLHCVTTDGRPFTLRLDPREG